MHFHRYSCKSNRSWIFSDMLSLKLVIIKFSPILKMRITKLYTLKTKKISDSLEKFFQTSLLGFFSPCIDWNPNDVMFFSKSLSLAARC